MESLRPHSRNKIDERGVDISRGKKVKIQRQRLKRGHFTSLSGRERKENISKCEAHGWGVPNYCFCSLNPLVCGVLVAVFVVLA